jgi:hypothetical protein
VTEFPIVCICGSTRFESLFHKIAEELTLTGHIVLTVNVWSSKKWLRNPQTPGTQLVKEMLDRIHKAKIELCDWVYVINKDGYIGESTKSEIEHAHKIGKRIEYLENPKVFINGDLSET